MDRATMHYAGQPMNQFFIFFSIADAETVWNRVTKKLDPATTTAEEESLEHREKK